LEALLLLVCAVLSIFFFVAQMRLFAISATLKEILHQLRAARQTSNPGPPVDPAREKILTRRILDGSLVPTVVGSKQTVKCAKCKAASTLKCTTCGGCEHCCKCALGQEAV
jgi:hypothetical protein